MKNLRSVNSVLLNTTRKKLWELLTSPEWTEKYMYNCRVISDFKVGSSIEWKGEFQGVKAHLTGEVLEIEPETRLKYSTIDPVIGNPDNKEEYVHITYEVTEQNAQFLLTVVNETFDGNEERMKHVVSGWESMVFPIMKDCLKV